MSFCFLYGACADRELLLNDPFFAASSSWPYKDLLKLTTRPELHRTTPIAVDVRLQMVIA